MRFTYKTGTSLTYFIVNGECPHPRLRHEQRSGHDPLLCQAGLLRREPLVGIVEVGMYDLLVGGSSGGRVDDKLVDADNVVDRIREVPRITHGLPIGELNSYLDRTKAVRTRF